MIRDRDQIYGTVVTRRLRAMGIRDKPTAPFSPWQNGFVERRESKSTILAFLTYAEPVVAGWSI